MADLGDVVPANMRAERARRKWTQPELAKRLGRSVTTVSEMENGKRKVGLNDLVPLCRALEVPMSVMARGMSKEDLEILGL